MHHVITKAEAEQVLAEYACDREEFGELVKRRGLDTIVSWTWQLRLELPDNLRPMIRGTESDVRG
jgi:hypothetical protein